MQKLIKLSGVLILAVAVIGIITGCTNINSKNESVAAAYFHKGVYETNFPDKNSSYKDFYIFYDENSGYTEDSKMGIGLPFSCVQEDGYVKFKFGGSEEPDDVFKIKSVENGNITGSFEDGSLLIFTPAPNANPDNFDAVEYVKKYSN